MRSPTRRSGLAFALALVAAGATACSGAGGRRGGRGALAEADAVHSTSLRFGYRYYDGYDPEAYSLGHDGDGNYINLFRMKSGRVLALRVVARPAVLNRAGPDEVWLWDVTQRGTHRGCPVPRGPLGRGQRVKIPGPQGLGGVSYRVRWRQAGADQILRVEGGGSWFEISWQRLRRARGAVAASQGTASQVPGLLRFRNGRAIEYFARADLQRAAPAGPVPRPRYVVVPYDLQWRPIWREHRIGSTGFVLVWQRGFWGLRPQEVRVGQVSYPRASASAIFKAQSPSAVTIETVTPHVTRWGSGTLVSSDGLVLTNGHVVPGAPGRHCTVTLWNKQVRIGKLVARHPTRDLALVRIAGRAGTYTPTTLHEGLPAIGAPILFIGSPAEGVALSLGTGMVSGLRQAPQGTLIQLQAPVNPGHSGGPLLDRQGRQIGVIVSRVERTPDGRPVQSHSYAIPAKVALAFLEAVSRRGKP